MTFSNCMLYSTLQYDEYPSRVVSKYWFYVSGRRNTSVAINVSDNALINSIDCEYHFRDI